MTSLLFIENADALLFQYETCDRDLLFEHRALTVSVLVGSEYLSNGICRSSSLGLHVRVELNDLSATLPVLL